MFDFSVYLVACAVLVYGAPYKLRRARAVKREEIGGSNARSRELRPKKPQCYADKEVLDFALC